MAWRLEAKAEAMPESKQAGKRAITAHCTDGNGGAPQGETEQGPQGADWLHQPGSGR